ncbi:LIPI [Bugula neritina]|uniref:LIPI n=1 Tax=Bugula neritina TaxID=10212 RepID=A0A7J7J722_BUGNE|nr:LIPI [Bugula neritina]
MLQVTMAEAEMNVYEYVTTEDQKTGTYQGLSAPRPIEAQPVAAACRKPAAVFTSTRICPSTWKCLLYTTSTWICPSYTATTWICPSNAATTGNAPHTQPPPGYVQQGYSAQPLAYGYVSGQQVIVQAPQPLPAVTDTGSTCWLVVGILTAILCCLPLGVAGAVMAYLSGEDARRGNAAAHKTKICQSKALTLTGLGIGLLFIIALLCLVGSDTDIFYWCYSGSFGYWTSTPGYSGTLPYDVSYLGCFDDSVFSRDLDGDDYDFGADLSVEKCTDYCSARSYLYAGLQNGNYCYCGTSYGSYGEVGQYECSSVCSADGLECGGFYTNSVYRTNYFG